MPFGEAMYLMLTGDTLSAQEAHRLGFVHEVLEPEALMPRAVEIAEMIGAKLPLRFKGPRPWRSSGGDTAGGVVPPQCRMGPACAELGGRTGGPASILRKAPAGMAGAVVTGGFKAGSNEQTKTRS